MSVAVQEDANASIAIARILRCQRRHPLNRRRVGSRLPALIVQRRSCHRKQRAGAALQKVGRKAMPKRVGRHTLADPGTLPCGAASRLKCAEADMIAGLLARKQP